MKTFLLILTTQGSLPQIIRGGRFASVQQEAINSHAYLFYPKFRIYFYILNYLIPKRLFKFSLWHLAKSSYPAPLETYHETLGGRGKASLISL